MLSLYCRTQNTSFVIICSAEDLLTLNSNEFRMVYKVDGNPQLDSRDWSMYSNILKWRKISVPPLKLSPLIFRHVLWK